MYIGTKVLLAERMTRGDYNTIHGLTLPPDGEDRSAVGYMVEYRDGHISWSPEEVFCEAYQTLDEMSFGHALRCMQDGKRVSRAGWNGKGMWITLSPGGVVPAEKLWAANNCEFAHRNGGSARVLPYITMKTADDCIVPWLASQTDLLANDWGVVE